ncbi:MAG: type II toxin-antitoxin system HicA family toxin [Planctomycetota bacterium]
MSPRLPRDVSGAELAKSLEAFGYVVTRQKGSHLRLTTFESGEHHVTVPRHDSLRTGTLNGILKDVAEHAGLSRDAVVETLLG